MSLKITKINSCHNANGHFMATEITELMTNELDPVLLKKDPHFTPISKLFLAEMFQQLNSANYSWIKHKSDIIKYQHLVTSFNDPGFANIPLEISSKFIKTVKSASHTHTAFKIGPRSFNLYLWFYTIHLTTAQTTTKQEEILKKIYTWLSVIDRHAIPTCSPNVDIYIYLTEHRKFMPTAPSRTIGELNVNTAFTYGCSNSSTNTIHVYREEEWFKAFIHETFHCFGLDFIPINDQANIKIKEAFPVSNIIAQSDIKLYETYTEMMAELMHLLYCSVAKKPMRNKGRIPIQTWLSQTAKLMRIEQSFSQIQCMKMMQYMHLTKLQLGFSAVNKVTHKRKIDMIDKGCEIDNITPILSYYVFKTMLYMNINGFIEFCNKNNSPQHILKFTQTNDTLSNFVNLIKQSSIYVRLPAIIMSTLPPFIRKTTRMTVYQLKDS